jgi:hypothetical protein
VTTAQSEAYRPTHQEVRLLKKHADIRLDRGDLGAMTEIVRELADATTTPRQRELVSELNGYLEFLRCQLPGCA